MAVELSDDQLVAIDKLRSGSILCGGVGSGKSRTALAFYYTKICEGQIKVNGKGEFSEMKNPRDLYIITTARKRDNFEWEQECGPFLLSSDPSISMSGVKVTVDSWNNIAKYSGVENSFFIFDEQRVIGSGVWVKAFYKIAKKNEWILATATPGDRWEDYIPVFVANGFYKNKTELLRLHAVYSTFSKYPKIERFIYTGRLEKFRDLLMVDIRYSKHTVSHPIDVLVPFDLEAVKTASVRRWNVYKEAPVKDAAELCYLLRKIVNSDPRRIDALTPIIEKRSKVIIFYNFDYELEILRDYASRTSTVCSEWNGHKHQPIPKSDKWMYLVQYSAGAEAWNCIETDTIIFYSLNYSYRTMTQAAGRTDRRNTPFVDLYYYYFKSNSIIDIAISKSISQKKDFNEQRFLVD